MKIWKRLLMAVCLCAIWSFTALAAESDPGNFVTVIRVDGELPKEQIREDAKPLEELTFTSALPFLLCDPEIFQEYIAIGTLCWIRGRVLRVSNINRLENKRRRTEHGNF